MAGFTLPTWSNLIHKLGADVSPVKQMKNGLKESNRKRYFFTVTANNTAVVEFIAPFNGTLEGILVASPSGATTSSSGNSVTMTVIDKNGNVTLGSFDTFVNKTELAVNTAAQFFNPQPAISGGVPVKSFSAGDVITFTALVTGTPGITSSGTLNVLITFVPADGQFSY
jgi:hypothetical protein